MIRKLALGGVASLLLACSDPECADGERKVGSTCLLLPKPNVEPDGQVPNVGPAEGDEPSGLPDDTTAPRSEEDGGIQAADGSTPQPRTRVVQLAIGGPTTFALWSDGTISLWGGYADDSDSDPSTPGLQGPSPHVVKPMRLDGIKDVKEIAASASYACVRFAAGDVGCWGNPGVISGRGLPLPNPRKIEGLQGVEELSVSESHACARTGSGSVSCWGRAFDANPSPDWFVDPYLDPPAVLPGVSDAVELDTGHHFTCIRKSDRTVQCAGSNGVGQLGDGTRNARAELSAVAGLRDVAQLAAGNSHTCASMGDGSVSCWGDNGSGKLGTQEARAMSPVPVAVGGSTSVALGVSHSCAILRNETVSCWGANTYGQLGDGTKSARATPASVGLAAAVEVRAGSSHTCARLASGGVWCWGSNDVGQLGDGTTTDRLAPVRVVGLE